MQRLRKPPPQIDESKYAGRWLALHPETLEIVADGATLREAEDVAAERGVTDPVFYPVPESDASFIGAGELTIRSTR